MSTDHKIAQALLANDEAHRKLKETQDISQASASEQIAFENLQNDFFAQEAAHELELVSEALMIEHQKQEIAAADEEEIDDEVLDHAANDHPAQPQRDAFETSALSMHTQENEPQESVEPLPNSPYKIPALRPPGA